MINAQELSEQALNLYKSEQLGLGSKTSLICCITYFFKSGQIGSFVTFSRGLIVGAHSLINSGKS